IAIAITSMMSVRSPIVKSQATLLFTSNLIPKLLVFYVSLLLNMPKIKRANQMNDWPLLSLITIV
ncbi:MAG: hypothetical protein P1U56_23980, partial [Saprospiraceae bacterium]|nr:hypothetical protein [Saprospiraceae bacterium]